MFNPNSLSVSVSVSLSLSLSLSLCVSVSLSLSAAGFWKQHGEHLERGAASASLRLGSSRCRSSGAARITLVRRAIGGGGTLGDPHAINPFFSFDHNELITACHREMINFPLADRHRIGAQSFIDVRFYVSVL